MDFPQMLKEFEESIKKERELTTTLQKQNHELRIENEMLSCELEDFKRIIKDEHPVINEWIESFKLQNIRYYELQIKLDEKDKEIKHLKEELAKSEKFTSEHIAFLMEALRREPLRVKIETD